MPISAQLMYNVDVVCEYIVKKIPVPVRWGGAGGAGRWAGSKIILCTGFFSPHVPSIVTGDEIRPDTEQGTVTCSRRPALTPRPHPVIAWPPAQGLCLPAPDDCHPVVRREQARVRGGRPQGGRGRRLHPAGEQGGGGGGAHRVCPREVDDLKVGVAGGSILQVSREGRRAHHS